jgi:hypothetical protein
MEIGSGLAIGFGSVSTAWTLIKLLGKPSTNGFMTKETCGIITAGHQRQLDTIEKKVDRILDHFDVLPK